MIRRARSTLACTLLAAALTSRGSAGDCNANGIPDELEGTGRLSFTPSRGHAVGALPHILEAADLDGDGDTDIVTTDRAADTLSLLVNDGRAGFAPALPLAVADEPRAIDSGDLDGDGDLDIASGNGNEHNAGDLPPCSVLLNSGEALFAQRMDHPANAARAGALRSTTLADMDGDGDLDLVNGFSDLAPGGIISLLQNDGKGVFSTPRTVDAVTPGFSTLLWAQYLAVGPVDGDQAPDVVTFSGQLLLNDGKGALGAPRTFTEVQEPRAVALADLDGDADLDVVLGQNVVSADIVGAVSVFLNEGGDLHATEEPVIVEGLLQTGLASGDPDLDGDLDVVLSTFDARVVVLVNAGAGRLSPFADPFPLEGGTPRWIIAADLNGDSRPDAACPMTSSIVSIILNLGAHDDDGNGTLDECEPPFLRADADGDGRMSITDAVFLLAHLFQGQTAPACLEAADSDDDGRLLLTDAVFLLAYLFQGGAPPPGQGPARASCGSARGRQPFLGCGRHTGCP